MRARDRAGVSAESDNACALLLRLTETVGLRKAFDRKPRDGDQRASDYRE